MVDFTPHEAPAREAKSLPVIVPGRPVGRDEELKKLYTQLKANQPVLICGAAGVGKTTLAATLAGAYTQQPGGVLWLDVDDSSLEALLVRIGRAYQVTEVMTSDTPLGMLGAVANTLTQHKPLVVLDGTISETVATNFITKCVSGFPVMIVTEEALTGPWETIELEKLDPDSAAILFKQQAGLTDNSADIDVFGVVKQVGYMPLAIGIAARGMLARKQTPGDYFKVLKEVSATVDNGQIAALTTGYKALTGALQGLILMMGAMFEGKSSAELLGMVSGAAGDSVQQAMNVLTQLYLVERSQRYGEPYYRLHPVVYAYAKGFLRTSDRLDSLQAKVCDVVLAYAQKYSRSDAEAYNKLATEMEAFLSVAAHWAEQDDTARDKVNELVQALRQAGDFVDTRGYVYELLTLRGLGSGSAKAFPAYGEVAPVDVSPGEDFDAFDDDQFDDELAAGRLEIEDDEEAEEPALDVEVALQSGELAQLKAVLTLVRQDDDTTSLIKVLNAIGKVQVDQDMTNEALSTYDDLLSLYEEEDDSEGILEALDMLSSLMATTDNAQAAILHASRGVKLAEELDDDDTRMHLNITLGDARQQLGESEEAERTYGQALAIARGQDDAQDEAIILYKLGYAQLDNGEVETATETWEQCLKLFRDQEKRDYEGRALGALGTAYGEQGLWSEALNFYTSALHIAREVGDETDEAMQLGNLGYAAVQADQLGQAVLRYRQALHRHYESENKAEAVSTIVDLVRLLLKSARHLSVSELLINNALELEPHDKTVQQLQERVRNEKMLAEANGIEFVRVSGKAEDYAANAYALLDE